MIEKVKVGIVGTGNLVSIADNHLKGYLENPDSEVVALFDVIYDSAVKWAKDRNLNSVHICKTYDELLDMVEAVSICTPNFTHIDLVISALKAGKHVLCEKPLSISYEDGQKSLEFTQKNKLVNMIGLCYRSVPAIKYLKQLIDGGKLGEIFMYRETMGGKRLADPNIPLEWRMKRKFSGTGALTDFGSHMVDMADFLLRDVQGKIINVNGYVNTYIKTRPTREVNNPGTVENDDCSVFSATMENGALLSFTASRVGTLGHKIEIIGSGGVAFYDEDKVTQLEVMFKDVNGAYASEKEIIQVPQELITDPWFNDEINQFVDAIKNNINIQPDLARGLYIQYIIDTIERSIIQGRNITL
jgi:predicted dehydrogenase